MNEFEIGDLVWAKMEGFSPWPGRITTPKEFLKKPNLKTKVECIFFFGTHNYAFIGKANIKPYLEFKSKFEKLCKWKTFKKAIAEIEDAIKKMGEDAKNDPEPNIKPPSTNELDEDEPKPKKRKRSSVPRPRTKNGFKSKDNSFKNVEDERTEPEVKIKREATTYALGFLGLGRMGRNIVKNLVITGHKVNIWNRTIAKADALKTELDVKYPGLVHVSRRRQFHSNTNSFSLL